MWYNRVAPQIMVMLLLTTGCGSEAPASTQLTANAQASLPVTVQLRVGEPIAIGDTPWALRFVAVPSDTRCPALVECIQAGEITLQFTLENALGGPAPDTPSIILGLTSFGDLQATSNGLTFRLESVTPERPDFISIDAKLYQATVHVQAAGTQP